MAAAVTEFLLQEVDNALQQAAKHREGLQRRVASASDRIRRHQTLARAEALTPSFRSDLLRRSRAMQKNRAHLLHVLRQYASVLPSGDLRGLCGLSNVEVVLRAVRDAVRVEEQLACWCQPLPRASAWRALCAAVRGSCHMGAASPQQQQRAEVEVEVALEQLLSPSDTRECEEDAATPSLPWVSLPCFCTMSHYCRHAQLSVVAAAAKSSSTATTTSSGGNTRHNNNNNNNDDDDGGGEVERGGAGVTEVMQTALHVVAAHLSSPSDEADDNSECDEAEEAAMEEARLRVSIEVAARATACRYAVESLAAGEDSIVFDGVVALTLPLFAAPVATLVLPPMEQLFFCIAYTIGAAILRDEQNERRAAATALTYIDEEGAEAGNNDDDNNSNSSESSGWRGVVECWMLQEQSTTGAFVGARLLQYLLEYVLRPPARGRQQQRAGAVLRPSTVRRWLVLVMGDAPEKDDAVEAMMTLFMNRQ